MCPLYPSLSWGYNSSFGHFFYWFLHLHFLSKGNFCTFYTLSLFTLSIISFLATAVRYSEVKICYSQVYPVEPTYNIQTMPVKIREVCPIRAGSHQLLVALNCWSRQFLALWLDAIFSTFWLVGVSDMINLHFLGLWLVGTYRSACTAGWKMLRARPVRVLKSLIELAKNSWKKFLLGMMVIWQYI